jgi:ketohexokinase
MPGAEGHLLTTVAADDDTAFVLRELHAFGASTDLCPVVPGASLPVSYIIVNVQNSSRTVIHYRNLRELTSDDFATIDLSRFSWIHFEGRHSAVYAAMMRRVSEYRAAHPEHSLRVSLELEQSQLPAFETLVEHADCVFIGKEFARSFGVSSAKDALAFVRPHLRRSGAVLFCAWGEYGADAVDADGQYFHRDAFPPAALVDTVGAGDTFNAAAIFRLSHGASVQVRRLDFFADDKLTRHHTRTRAGGAGVRLSCRWPQGRTRRIFRVGRLCRNAAVKHMDETCVLYTTLLALYM